MARINLKVILDRTVLAVVIVASVLYVGDLAVWKTRMAKGGGMGTVSVGTMIETPLKGNKEEYDWAGTVQVTCSRSIFPQAGSGACWWLERHPVVYEK
jgi:hypothetical protein